MTRRIARIIFVFTLVAITSSGINPTTAADGPDWSAGATELATLPGHEQGIIGAVFSPDGRYLTLRNKDFHVDIWDAATGESLAHLAGLNSWPQHVAYSPDGTVLAAADLKRLRLWQVPGGGELALLDGCDGPFAWRPDGTGIVGTFKNSETPYELRTVSWPAGEVTGAVEDAHPKLVRQMTWSPDGGLLGTSSDDGTLKLWGGQPLALVRTLAGDVKVGRFAFSPDGALVAAITGKDPGGILTAAAVYVWDVATGELKIELTDFPKGLEPLAWSPDGTLLATGERQGNRARLWSIPSGELVKALPDHPYTVARLAFSPDGRFLATGSANQVTVWDIATGTHAWQADAASQGLTDVRFSPDGGCVVTTSTDNSAKIWQVNLPGD
ncbi:MAG: WD40 repeat domain-containing protein [bacterium]